MRRFSSLLRSRRVVVIARSALGIGVAALLVSACGTSGPVQRVEVAEADALAPIVSPAAEADFAAALDAMAGDDLVEAELRLKQFVLEYPQFPGGFVNLAIVYGWDGRYEDARAALDQALALEPMHASANHQLGILLRQQGEFADAEQAYLRALETAPEFALAHRNLGILLDLYLYRPSEALHHYRRYQELIAEPDAIVGRWIIDLERRVDSTDDTARLAQGDGA
jgi:tetratricopeptide (TPR) repeat protein